MKTIAVIGSAGTNARAWTNAFLAASWRVRNLVRNPNKVAPRAHLTPVVFDFDDRRTYEPALAGVDVLALISPTQPQQVAWENELIAAAHHVGVGGVIKLSVIGAEMAEPISFFARNAAQVEKVLHRSGAPHIVLRARAVSERIESWEGFPNRL